MSLSYLPPFYCKLLEASDAVSVFLVLSGPRMGPAQSTQYMFLMMLAPGSVRHIRVLLWLIASITKFLLSTV